MSEEIKGHLFGMGSADDSLILYYDGVQLKIPIKNLMDAEMKIWQLFYGINELIKIRGKLFKEGETDDYIQKNGIMKAKMDAMRQMEDIGEEDKDFVDAYFEMKRFLNREQPRD